MSETLIKVENVSKKFCRTLKKSLWYGMQDLGNELIGRRRDKNDLRPDEFWAVKDVSFELKQGECLGLIGRNGAGKTTLLRMLNGLIKPDSGRIEMHGRVGALIALGAGFNPILTGRENVFVSGAILGMSPKEIHAKFDEIVEFAGLNEFIDSPVQSYSSGMQVRLGFSVAAQLKPDILLLDEVLAVGDAEFQVKCVNLVRELQRSGVAIVLVSHSMTDIMRYADIGMYLDRSIKKFGATSEVVSLYMRDQEPLVTPAEITTLENFGVLLKPIFVTDENGTVLDKVHPFQQIWIHVPYVLEKEMEGCEISLGLGINDMAGVFYQGRSEPILFKGGNRGDSGEFVAYIDGLRAATGTLVVGVALWIADRGSKIGWSRENRIVVENEEGSTGRAEIKPVWEHRFEVV